MQSKGKGKFSVKQKPKGCILPQNSQLLEIQYSNLSIFNQMLMANGHITTKILTTQVKDGVFSLNQNSLNAQNIVKAQKSIETSIKQSNKKQSQIMSVSNRIQCEGKQQKLRRNSKIINSKSTSPKLQKPKLIHEIVAQMENIGQQISFEGQQMKKNQQIQCEVSVQREQAKMIIQQQQVQ